MNTQEVKEFSDDCDCLLAGLEHLRDEGAVARSTLHLPRRRTARETGMLSKLPGVSPSRSQILVTVKRRPGDCPRSIKRLCKSAAAAKTDISTRVSGLFNSPPQSALRPTYVPEKPLLVRRWDEDHVYEVSVITTESLLEPDWSGTGDAVFSWSSIFQPNSPFCLVSTNTTFKNWAFFLRCRGSDEIRSSIDGWVAAALARKIRPWDEERGNAIRSLIELRYQWTYAFVRLRPLAPTIDDSSMRASAGFLERQRLHSARQRPSEPWMPASRARSDLISR